MYICVYTVDIDPKLKHVALDHVHIGEYMLCFDFTAKLLFISDTYATHFYCIMIPIHMFLHCCRRCTNTIG